MDGKAMILWMNAFVPHTNKGRTGKKKKKRGLIGGREVRTGEEEVDITDRSSPSKDRHFYSLFFFFLFRSLPILSLSVPSESFSLSSHPPCTWYPQEISDRRQGKGRRDSSGEGRGEKKKRNSSSEKDPEGLISI